MSSRVLQSFPSPGRLSRPVAQHLAGVSPRAAAAALRPEATAVAGYLAGGPSGMQRRVLLLILVAHAGLVAALFAVRHAAPEAAIRAIEVVNIMQPPPAPPPAAAPRTTGLVVPDPLPPAFTVVEPVVTVAVTPVHVVAPTPPAPAPVIPAPTTVAAAGPPAPAIVNADDLGMRMSSAVAPRYPVESRRRCEQGEVVLEAVVDEAGTIAALAVARSSGHERLDDAALRAVQRWRWAPTLRAGRAVPVRGRIAIPFVLSNAAGRC